MASIDSVQKKEILLVGVGNILLGDEGAGVHTVERLRQEGLPGNVEAVDGGTAGLELMYLLENVSKLVVVDSIDAGMRPGSIFRLRPRDIRVRKIAGLSFHDLGLPEVLTLAETMGKSPVTVICGIQPAKIDWALGLSPVIEEKLPDLMVCVRQELKTIRMAH